MLISSGPGQSEPPEGRRGESAGGANLLATTCGTTTRLRRTLGVLLKTSVGASAGSGVSKEDSPLPKARAVEPMSRAETVTAGAVVNVVNAEDLLARLIVPPERLGRRYW